VKKWITVDQTTSPDGRTISLHEHDGDYTIRADGATLMSTRKHASEEKLGELACQHVKEKRRARILIGGLGFGYTLRAVLAAVPGDAGVVVAELVPAVIAWNRLPSLKLAADAMADRRVTIIQGDAGDVIRKERGGFDSIILDVDNGPAELSTAGNSRLYDYAGLQITRAALRPGGCLAVWSAAPDPAFAKLMTRAGFTVDVQRCRAHSTSGGRHTLFLGRLK
jgi:spermidine synthase